MEGFETVKNDLEIKRKQLEQELDSARGIVRDIETDLERVHEALGALTGGAKKKARKSSRSKKPVPTVEDLQRHIEHVREQHPFAGASMLESSVRALVKESGGSLSGFKALFAEALVSSPGTHGGSSHSGTSHHAQQHEASHHHSGHAGAASHGSLDSDDDSSSFFS